MKKFGGFPARMDFTAVPNLFFTALLPQIDDMAELKTTLHIFRVLYARKGYPRFVTYGELSGDAALAESLKGEESPVGETLRRALEAAVKRGTIRRLVLDRDGESEDVYFLNSARDAGAIDKIESGELKLSGLKAAGPAHVEAEAPPDIFTLYEQNIGMLTPMIADELTQAERLYPAAWIRDAIAEAVSLNKRNWRYISRILERWLAEGRKNGAYKRDSKADPDKYIKGKYGHMVRR